jgi:predicted MFS family arabinose efflux permease
MTDRVDAPPWRVPQVRATIAAVVFGFVGFAVLLGALPARLSGLGFPSGAAGVATTATLVATVAVQLVTPALLHRFSARMLLAIGLLLLGAPAPFYALVTSMPAIVGLSVLRGAGFALITVIGALTATEAVTPNRRGAAIGLYGLGAAIPIALGPGLGTALTERGAFTAVCFIAAVPILGLPACWFIGRLAASDSDHHAGAAAVLRACAWPCLLLFVVTAAGGGIVTLLPVVGTGLPVTAALLVFGITSVLSRWLVGGLSDRIGASRLVVPLSAIMVLGVALIGPALLPDRSALLLTAVGVAGIGYGALQSITLGVSLMQFAGRDAATVSTAWNVAFDAGTGLGAGLLTWSAAGRIGPVGSFAALAVLTAAVAAATALSLRVSARRRSQI